MPIFGGHLCCALRMGRNTGVEPVHVRFTAECVHRFTNCAVPKYYSIQKGTSQKETSNTPTFCTEIRVSKSCFCYR